MNVLIAALTHCAANENEQKMANLVARFNANQYYQAQVSSRGRGSQGAPGGRVAPNRLGCVSVFLPFRAHQVHAAEVFERRA
jgi:hypothetical protein